MELYNNYTYSERPLVSIVTVVLNGASHIEKAIKSVLGQRYTPIEYILIDGGSTDGTLDIAHKYEEYLDHLISEKDNGIYDAMNKGIDMASGELIGILNADDFFFQNTVERVVNIAKDTNAGILHGAIEVRMEFPNKCTYHVSHGDAGKLTWKASVNHPSCFVHRNVYEQVGKFDTRYRISSDYDFLLRAFKANIPFQYIDAPLVSYLYGGASLSCKSDLENYRIMKEHNTGNHRKCLSRYMKCVLKQQAKMLMGRKY